ncbi:MAG: AAA family ATPase [Chitinophagaceae bacterium]|nr:AAA family ATPase [Chitinophagaceae bacterium]
MDSQKANAFVQKQFSIVQRFFRKDMPSANNDDPYWNELYLLQDDIIVGIECSGNVCFSFDAQQEATVADMVQQLQQHAQKKKTPEQCALQIIVSKRDGLGLEELTVPKLSFSLQRNYQPEATQLFNMLRSKLRQPATSGLVLLHGAPGTGKTSFIQYLLARQPRKVLALSPDMASELDKPSMTSLLCKNKGAILLLEDAEDLIVSRQQNRSSALATLLNLSDGLIGRSLGIIVIASFNCPVKNIDAALLRKGRLLAMYEFQALAAEQASKLLLHLGMNVVAQQPMTLADIYSYEINSFQYQSPKPSTIGFNQAKAG